MCIFSLRRWLVTAITLCLALSFSAHADDDEFTLAAYNVKNLLDVFDDPYSGDEDIPVKPRREIDALADAVRALDADVVAFCEVENRGVLEAFVNETLGGMGYRHIAVVPTNSSRGIHLGVVSRLPIDAVTSYRHRDLTLPGDDTTWRFARDLMRVTLALPDGRRLELFNVHFKSKRDSANDPRSAKWRLAEAEATAAIVSEVAALHPDRWIAVAGDFNDTPGTATYRAILAAGLHDAHAGLPDSRRITFLREPHRSTIDYLFVNRPMRDALSSATVLRDAAMLRGSDHAPIAATFRLDD